MKLRFHWFKKISFFRFFFIKKKPMAEGKEIYYNTKRSEKLFIFNKFFEINFE